MSLAVFWQVVVSACLGVDLGPAPLAWNGAWLAHVETQAAVPERLPRGWIFGDAPDPPPGIPQRFRLWVNHPDTGGSVLLEDSPTPLSSPGWSPNGRVIAFLRIISVAAERSRLELVVQDAPDHRRVVWTHPLPSSREPAHRWVQVAPAWSSDGLFVAVPLISPVSVVIVRVADGRADENSRCGLLTVVVD